MLTREAVLEKVIAGTLKSKAIDGRDFSRLVEFFPIINYEAFGFTLNGGVDQDKVPQPPPWTEEEVKKQMLKDVEFGIEKAEGQRGISSDCMRACVHLWLTVLEDDLADDAWGRSDYGLRFFKAVRAKYGAA